VFPVRYRLDFYILFRRKSVFKGLSDTALGLGVGRGAKNPSLQQSGML
jgi:hypothetical protein